MRAHIKILKILKAAQTYVMIKRIKSTPKNLDLSPKKCARRPYLFKFPV